MKPRSFSSASVFSAAILSVVTLLVFFVLQDYGPESSLRKFHEAIVQKDPRKLAQVMTGQLSDPPNVEYVDLVGSLLVGQNARYRLLRTDHRDGKVGAEVQYLLPSGKTTTIYWVLSKVGPDWRVDPALTQKIMPMPVQDNGGLVGFNNSK
jgi:hypothetical protein